MSKFVFLLAALAVSSAAVINLDVMCGGFTFQALSHPSEQNKFIGCVHGKGQILSCQLDYEIFDPFSSQCVVSEAPEDFSADNICSNVLFGLFEIENDCTQFIMCQLMQKFVRSCPSHTIFDINVPGCVLGNRDTCEPEYGHEHQTTTHPATTTEHHKTTGDHDLQTTRAPTTTEHHRTTGDHGHETTARDTVTTEHQTSTTEINETTTTRQPEDIEISFVCPISGWGDIPDHSDCTRFYECIQGVQHPRTCPPGLIFDVIRSECDDSASSFCAVNIRCGA